MTILHLQGVKLHVCKLDILKNITKKPKPKQQQKTHKHTHTKNQLPRKCCLVDRALGPQGTWVLFPDLCHQLGLKLLCDTTLLSAKTIPISFAQCSEICWRKYVRRFNSFFSCSMCTAFSILLYRKGKWPRPSSCELTFWFQRATSTADSKKYVLIRTANNLPNSISVYLKT